MPDRVKIELLRKMGWGKVEGCITCIHSSNGASVKGTFGNCQHPKMEYVHEKQGPKKAPCHAGAKCKLYEPAVIVGLDELDELVNPR